MTALRRGMSLLMLGLVCAASTGLAWHDPECVTHQGLHEPAAETHAAAETHPAAAAHAGAVHGDAHDPVSHSDDSEECSCLGFCALGGQSPALAAGATPAIPVAAHLHGDVGDSGSDGIARTSAATLQPPATGPPIRI